MRLDGLDAGIFLEVLTFPPILDAFIFDIFILLLLIAVDGLVE